MQEIRYRTIPHGWAFRPTIHASDQKTLHRFGWGLVSLAGSDAALGLIDDLLNDGTISPHFATFLRTKWQAIAARMEDSTRR